jgi:hypothetical protein
MYSKSTKEQWKEMILKNFKLFFQFLKYKFNFILLKSFILSLSLIDWSWSFNGNKCFQNDFDSSFH